MEALQAGAGLPWHEAVFSAEAKACPLENIPTPGTGTLLPSEVEERLWGHIE